LPSAVETWQGERWEPTSLGQHPHCHPPMSPCPTPPSPHLQGDVGPGPVLQVGELQVRVTVHEVDAQQLLALGAAEAGQALAEGTGTPLHARGPVLALGSLTEARLASGAGWHLAELAAAGPSVLLGTGLGKRPTHCPPPPWDSDSTPLFWGPQGGSPASGIRGMPG